MEPLHDEAHDPSAPSGVDVAANLALDERVGELRREGVDVLHLGFGEAGLPVHDGLAEALTRGLDRNAYGPVAGDRGARVSVAGYFARRGLATDPDQIVLGPGSKPLLWAVLQALGGDVVLPRPSWLTYAAQADLVGRQVVWVDIPREWGGLPDPALLRRQLADAASRGARARSVVLTLPDNPTGTLPDAAAVREVADIAAAEGLAIVSDEIYRDIVFDGRTFVSPAEVAPDRTIVMTGLSKSLALGGWRIGAARFPATDWGSSVRSRVLGIGSQVWSSLAGPQQVVAEYAFSEPGDLVAYRDACTRLHARVTLAVHGVFDRHGVAGRTPGGAFYVYPDLEPIRPGLEVHGVAGSADLAGWLLDRHGLAVLEGVRFGDDPKGLRFRAATSMLYGDTRDARMQAVRADDPLDVPHVRRALERLDAILGEISSA